MSYIHHHSSIGGPIVSASAAAAGNTTTIGNGARRPALHKLCRICSGEGLYNLHQPIPFFLHGCHTELDQWPDTIAQMVADVGGLEYGPISVDDELPQRICSICISYLKHAVQFRQQALATVRNLKFASMLAQIDDKSAELTVTEGAVVVAADRNDFNAGGETAKFYKANGIVAANQTSGSNSTTAELRRELDQFFADELTATTTASSSSSDNDDDGDDDDEDADDGVVAARKLATAAGRQRTLRAAIHDFFNYSETPFAEDDALTGDRIAVRAPDDDHKERKCYACKRQFLLNTSYDEHMKACVQAKLLEFVGGCQRLVELQRDRVVSEQEFIRRMVFAVKSVVKALAMCYRGASAAGQMLGSKDVPKQMFVAKTVASGGVTSGAAWPKAPNMPQYVAIDAQQQQPNNGSNAGRTNSGSVTSGAAVAWPKAPAPFNNNGTMGASMMSPAPPMPAAPMHHFINNPVTPIAAAATTRPLFPKVTNFAAACLACGLRFGSIHELEQHNRQRHNNPQQHQHSHGQYNNHDTGSSGHTSTTTPASTEDETPDADLVALLRSTSAAHSGQRQRQLVKRYGRPI